MVTGARPTQGKRDSKNLVKLTKSPTLHRFAIVNHFDRTVNALSRTSNFPKLKAFLPQNLWPWLWNYLKNAFTPRFPFQIYGNGKTGVYLIAPTAGSNTIKIAIAGDWGTGTQEAQTI